MLWIINIMYYIPAQVKRIEIFILLFHAITQIINVITNLQTILLQLRFDACIYVENIYVIENLYITIKRELLCTYRQYL